MLRMIIASHWLPVWSLCITQVISWGTLYYAFSVLLGPIGSSRGWNQAEMVGAFSLSLVLSGISAYPAGKLIHRRGGRWAMSMGSALAALAFIVIAVGQSLETFYLGWAVAGFAMALTLYEAAFAVLALAYDADYRQAVTTVTLAGGFASTLFWPLTERMVASFGWQGTLLFYAGLHLLVCLPLHRAGLPRLTAQSRSRTDGTVHPLSLSQLLKQPRFVALASSFTLNSIIFAAVSVHLIPMLETKGASSQQAVWLAAAAGPMQVVGRLIDFIFSSRWNAAHTGVTAMLGLISALLGLMTPEAPFSALAAIVGLYGLSNGVMTIVRSLSVVELFGRQNYAAVGGAIAAPAILSRAVGPFFASVVFTHSRGYGLVLLALGALAVLSLVIFIRANHQSAHQTFASRS